MERGTSVYLLACKISRRVRFSLPQSVVFPSHTPRAASQRTPTTVAARQVPTPPWTFTSIMLIIKRLLFSGVFNGHSIVMSLTRILRDCSVYEKKIYKKSLRFHCVVGTRGAGCVGAGCRAVVNPSC